MAFSNVFDSSLVDYSKDNEQQDNKYYNDNIVDIVANQIKSGKNIPHTFCFKNFTIHSKIQDYNYPNNYVLYDKETKICYATEIVEYVNNLRYFLEYAIDENELEDHQLSSKFENIGMIIVKIPALNNNNFVFFYDVDEPDLWEKSSNIEDWKNVIKDDDSIKCAKTYVKDKYHVLNYGSPRFKLCIMRVIAGDEEEEYDLE